MNESGYRNEIVDYWLNKARDSLCSARDELKAGRSSFAVNRIYYACFYAVSAYLLWISANDEKLCLPVHRQ